nr:uncharacterized protein LOC109161852 [Ipomoea trifida]GLL26521.1 uncharacterized protein LOC109161852 [Ipomoea trifida]
MADSNSTSSLLTLRQSGGGFIHGEVDGGRYTKIAVQLNNKMVRDVALRYRWMAKKENARKTKDDLNPLRKMKDKKVNTTW